MKWVEHLLDDCDNDGMKDKYNSKKAITEVWSRPVPFRSKENTMPCKRGIALSFLVLLIVGLQGIIVQLLGKVNERNREVCCHLMFFLMNYDRCSPLGDLLLKVYKFY